MQSTSTQPSTNAYHQYAPKSYQKQAKKPTKHYSQIDPHETTSHLESSYKQQLLQYTHHLIFTPKVEGFLICLLIYGQDPVR